MSAREKSLRLRAQYPLMTRREIAALTHALEQEDEAYSQALESALSLAHRPGLQHLFSKEVDYARGDFTTYNVFLGATLALYLSDTLPLTYRTLLLSPLSRLARFAWLRENQGA